MPGAVGSDSDGLPLPPVIREAAAPITRGEDDGSICEDSPAVFDMLALVAAENDILAKKSRVLSQVKKDVRRQRILEWFCRYRGATFVYRVRIEGSLRYLSSWASEPLDTPRSFSGGKAPPEVQD